jgi:hypothetical protein
MRVTMEPQTNSTHMRCEKARATSPFNVDAFSSRNLAGLLGLGD